MYSILSPEGFASILWKDAGRSGEAAELMRMTAADLLELGVADEVIPEPEGGAHSDPQEVFEAVDRSLSAALARVVKEGSFAARRQEKFRRMGAPPPGRRIHERTEHFGHWPQPARPYRDQRRPGPAGGDQQRLDRQPHRASRERRFAQGETLTQLAVAAARRAMERRGSAPRTSVCA